MTNKKYTPAQKLILSALIYKSSCNQIQITIDDLSKMTGLSKSTIGKGIDYLCSQEVLSKQHMFVEGEKFMNHRKQANLYTIHISLNDLFAKEG